MDLKDPRKKKFGNWVSVNNMMQSLKAISRTQSITSDVAFCENISRLKLVNNFRKKLLFRCLTMFWIYLWVVNEVWVGEELISLMRIKNQHKNQRITKCYSCDKCVAMDKNVECLCCHEVEPLEYFELLGMRYGDMNAVNQKV